MGTPRVVSGAPEETDDEKVLPRSVPDTTVTAALPRLTGCPMGCPLDHHECGVGEPIRSYPPPAPVSRRRGPWLYVTVDQRRRVLLLRGDGARDVCGALSLRATYSRAGRGQVVALEYLADIVAYCEHRHALCVVSERKRATA